MKRFFASCVLLLSTSTYAMNHAHIDAQSIEAFEERSTRDTSYSRYFSPLYRFINEDFVSNLRFVVSHDQWDSNYHSQVLATEDCSFAKDAMTQLVHFLFPSTTGNYLTVNQMLDAVTNTNAQQFYRTLMSMRQGREMDVWAVFTSLFHRDLSPSARGLIAQEINTYSISQFGETARSKHLQRHEDDDKILEELIESGILKEGLLESEDGVILTQSLMGQGSWWDTIQAQADAEAVTQNDFYCYLLANSFLTAFMQERTGDYATGTLDRVVATYAWKKTKNIEDVRFLFPEESPLTDIKHADMRKRIKPIIENPIALRRFYAGKRYDDIWAYIYRDRLMLDDQNVPLIKSRMTIVNGRPMPDYVETAIRNMTNFFCFKDEAFDPTFWKEGSILRDYYTEFQHISPHDPRSRTEWAKRLANIPGIHYYSPSKRFMDTTNTEEMVPGILNMFRILAEIGKHPDEPLISSESMEWEGTWGWLTSHFRSMGDRITDVILSKYTQNAFRMLMTDLTGGHLTFGSIRCVDIRKSSNNNDFTGNFYMPVTDGEQFEWDFRPIDSISKYDLSRTKSDKEAEAILLKLGLYVDLKSHYSEFSTNALRTEPLVTKFLMENDLQSLSYRQLIKSHVLGSHRSLPLLRSLFNKITRDNDVSEKTDLINNHIKAIFFYYTNLETPREALKWADAAPKLFTERYANSNKTLIEILYRKLNDQHGIREAQELAIEFMKRAKFLTIENHSDSIACEISYFENLLELHDVPFMSSDEQLFDLSGLNKLKQVSFKMSKNKHSFETTLVMPSEKISNFVQKIPGTVDKISFHHINNTNGLLNVFNIVTQMREHGKTAEVLLCDTDCLRNIKREELEQRNSALFAWVSPYLS
ncbi:MAG: hypothetical protein V4482_06480 [Pseudomonadota bacterium]